MDGALTIGEVAKRSGTATSALRFYEEQGLIHSERNDSGHRRYPRAVIRRVAFIVFAQRIGLSLEEIRTELAYLQNQAGNAAMIVFALAVVFVFLVLAAQYESWKLPLAVILVVPMCLLFAIVGVNVAGQDVTIFTQIGFIVLVGLACKNAILIVEFAKHRREEGKPVHEAAVEASRLRLRPILMTSFAFIFGVVPLVVAGGAGAEMRRSLGIAVFSGMLGVTLFGIFLTPVFFRMVQWIGWEAPHPAADSAPSPSPPSE